MILLEPCQGRSTFLEKQLFAVLKQAMTDNRFDVADHLLRALEVLAPDSELGSTLGRAYILIAEPEDS